MNNNNPTNAIDKLGMFPWSLNDLSGLVNSVVNAVSTVVNAAADVVVGMMTLDPVGGIINAAEELTTGFHESADLMRNAIAGTTGDPADPDDYSECVGGIITLDPFESKPDTDEKENGNDQKVYSSALEAYEASAGNSDQNGNPNAGSMSIHWQGMSVPIGQEPGFSLGRGIGHGFVNQSVLLSDINNRIAPSGLGYYTPLGEFVYTGPQTITIGGSESLVYSSGEEGSAGLFISRGGANDDFILRIGTYQGGGIAGGYNISADYLNVGIYNTSGVNGSYNSANWNSPLIGGSVVVDGDNNLSGFTLGYGPGGFGGSISSGYTLTQNWLEF